MLNGGVDFSDGFGGYWFTIVLFQMYLIYLLFSLISRILHHDIVLPSLAVLSAIFVGILVLGSRDSRMWNFFCWENLTKYMQFFTAGLICSKYRNLFFKVLSNNIFIMAMVTGWTVCMLLWYNDSFKAALPFAYSVVHDIAVRYFALFTVVIMFFSSQDKFSGDTVHSRMLRFIGRRTLDIYMIHYFFLPDLSGLSGWLSRGNMIVPQLAISISVSVVIVALCLLISSILRKSDILESWLFGVKRRI